MINTQFLKSHRPQWVIGAIALATALVIIFASPRSPAPAAPDVSWTPSSVTKVLLAGESLTIPLSFTTHSALKGAVVFPVPELRPYVAVHEPILGDLDPDVTVSFNLSVSVPPDTLPGDIEGVVQIRGEEAPERVFAKPLPVNLTVEWLSYSNTQLGFSMTYPPNLLIIATPDLDRSVGFTTQDRVLNDLNHLFYVKIDTLPGNTTLEDWIIQFVSHDLGTSVSMQTIGGRDYFVRHDLFGTGREAFSYTTMLNADTAISVTTRSLDFAASSQLVEILGSITSSLEDEE